MNNEAADFSKRWIFVAIVVVGSYSDGCSGNVSYSGGACGVVVLVLLFIRVVKVQVARRRRW